MTAAHLAPTACHICGEREHPPTDSHTYWANQDAARHFAARAA